MLLSTINGKPDMANSMTPALLIFIDLERAKSRSLGFQSLQISGKGAVRPYVTVKY